MSWGEIHETVSSNGLHHFSTHRPADLGSWLKEVATEYINLRTESVVPLPESLDVSGIGLFDVSQIKALLASAVVPADDTRRGAFSVTRSDLSEVAAYMLLERKYGTRIAYKLVRDRELIQLPGRGIDAVGIENGDKLLVVLGEVKFSDEDSAPDAPQVVDRSKDCMRLQHRAHLSDLQLTVAKLWDCARRAKDLNLQQYLISAALYLDAGKEDSVEIVSCCVLVRPEERHSPGDFGSFLNAPEDFAPARVRFLVWSLPADMDTLLSEWTAAVEAERLAV